MNFLFTTLNPLQILGGASADGGTPMSYMLVMFGLLFLIFYFLIIRPQNKRQKDTQKMLDNLKKGDKVQSIGGIRGTVKELKDDTVVVTVDDGTNLMFVRSAIANVINPEEKAQDKKDAKKTEKNAKKEEKEDKEN